MQYDIEESLFTEFLLMEIKGVSISYFSHVKRQRNRQENSLLKDLEDLESREQLDLEMIEVKKESLEHLRKKKLQGHFIRSRAQWVEEGEKPLKYFCNLEKQNYQKVELGNGTIIYNQSEILEHVRLFYEELYCKNEADLTQKDLEDLLDKSNVNKLQLKISKTLDENISEKEVLEVLKNMKNNKSPGSDGFTAEFYNFF